MYKSIVKPMITLPLLLEMPNEKKIWFHGQLFSYSDEYLIEERTWFFKQLLEELSEDEIFELKLLTINPKKHTIL